MNDFNKYELYKDYWYFTPKIQGDFTTLSQLNYSSWSYEQIKQIEVRINTFDNADNPAKTQVEALNFVIKNQYEIINNIFKYYQNVILPVYQAASDIDETEIAHHITDLSLIFGVKVIEIPQLDNPQSIYFLIEFDFQHDDERGLYILFEATKPIDFFARGEQNFDAIKIFEGGLKNENGEPLKFRLHQLNGQILFQKACYFDEQIEFSLVKGTYRAFIIFNQTQICRNFYVPNDLTTFSMKDLFTFELKSK